MQFARKLSIRPLALHWKPLALYGSLFAVLAATLFWRLGSLLPGYSVAELDTYQDGLHISGLLEDPLNAPFLLALWALQYFYPDNLLATRIVAVVFGLGVLALFCWLLRTWHDDKTAIIGTLLFGLSAWFLHVARMGTPEVLMLGALVLVACGYWLRQSKGWLALLMCFALTTVLAYTPGMIWLIIVGAVWQWKTIDYTFKKHLGTVSLGTLLLLAGLAPLAWAIYKDPGLVMPWLGLPETLPHPLDVLQSILAVPYHLFVANSSNPAAWLGRAPVLDIFSAAMFVIGGYLYLRNIRLLRTPLLISLLTVGTILVALGGAVTLSILIPFIYLVLAAGIGYLFDQWLEVFPRNPIAKAAGAIVIALVVALTVTYHTRHYFIGWPEAQATHDTYTIQKP